MITSDAASFIRLRAQVGIVSLVVFAFASVWIVSHAMATPLPISLRVASGGESVIATGSAPTIADRDALLFAIANGSPNGIVLSTVEVDADAKPLGEPSITASELLSQLIGDDD